MVTISLWFLVLLVVAIGILFIEQLRVINHNKAMLQLKHMEALAFRQTIETIAQDMIDLEDQNTRLEAKMDALYEHQIKKSS